MEDTGIAYGPREEALVEYRELRAEIRDAQNSRLQIVSITVGAFVAVLTVFLRVFFDPGTQLDNVLAISIGGTTVLLALLIPSLIMAITTQQAIVRKGDYIRRFIESAPNSGCKWETRLLNAKPGNMPRSRVFGLVGIYLFLIALSWTIPGYALYYHIMSGTGFNYSWLFVIPGLLTLWALYLTIDLQKHFSAGWKWMWENVEI